MLRRLMLAALALCALLALAGCGANQMMAPDVATELAPAADAKPPVLGKRDPANEPRIPETPTGPGQREGDGMVAGIESCDTLYWAGDPVR